jgi:ABC transporter substrate binding protein
MNRREFITLIGGAAANVPFAARAQQHFKIGLLETGADSFFFTVPFTHKLEELGYVESKNLVIERRPAEGNTERLKDFAAELVQQRVDVIVTIGTPAGFAAKQATTNPSFWALTVIRSEGSRPADPVFAPMASDPSSPSCCYPRGRRIG